MKRRLLTTLFLLFALGLGGIAFAWSGLYNVAASEGHWAITRWFLEFGMENSVETQSIGIEAPPLDDPALVQRGAGHYFGGCMTCHGAPGESRNPIVKQMLPPPPVLADKVRSWNSDELFWIVKNGLKYTGMPAWVAQERDDEVWSLVAFLERLPDMDAEEYRELAQGEQTSSDRTAIDAGLPLSLAGAAVDALQTCARCHGLDGTGRGTGAFPRLTRQSPEYLYAAMKDYALGLRPSGIMQPVAAELTDSEMRDLATYYAGIDAPSESAPVGIDPDIIQKGEAVALEGMPEQGVPACASCHGPAAAPRNPRYPSLAGQYAGYIAQQLRLWKQDARGDTTYARIMEAAVRNLDETAIEAVSLYYASLQSGSAPSPAQAPLRPSPLRPQISD